MEFKTITYKLIKNLGNYESATLELSAEIHPREDPAIVASVLMEKVERILRVGEHAPKKCTESNDENTDYF